MSFPIRRNCRKTINKNKIIATCNADFINGTYPEFCINLELTCSLYNKYRSFNGSCNNLNYPDRFGVAYNSFRRIIQSDYADGKYNKWTISKVNKLLGNERTYQTYLPFEIIANCYVSFFIISTLQLLWYSMGYSLCYFTAP